MMAALLAEGLAPPAVALTRSISASDRPAPNAPIFRKPRRLMPSQKRWRAPQSVNIAVTPLVRNPVLPRATQTILTPPSPPDNPILPAAGGGGAAAYWWPVGGGGRGARMGPPVQRTRVGPIVAPCGPIVDP